VNARSIHAKALVGGERLAGYLEKNAFEGGSCHEVSGQLPVLSGQLPD
jgi:hypothetical protein